MKFNKFIGMSAAAAFLSVTAYTGCTQIGATGTGAAAGTAIGAGLGAIVGNQTGNPERGTAIGAGAGMVTGALIGGAFDYYDKQTQAMIADLKQAGVETEETARGVVLNLSEINDVYFEFDKATLTDSAKVKVAEIGSILRQVPERPVLVEGHTDAIGSDEYNKKLSLERAVSVAETLETHGVNKDRLKVQGLGEQFPVATNDSDIGRAQNRRVEIVVINSQS